MGVVRYLTVDESLQVESESILQGTVPCLLDEDLSLSDTPIAISRIEKTAEETFSIGFSDTNTIIRQPSIDEVLGLMPDIGGHQALQKILEENFTLQDTLADAVSVLFSELLESLSVADSVADVLGEAEEEIWDCWVLSTQELLPSVYSGFNFNSYANREGVIYAANTEGIFKLTDDHLEEFQPGILLSPTSMGMSNQKRFRSGFLSHEGENTRVKAKADDGAEHIYPLKKNKFSVRRDQVGRRWTFAVADFESLDFIELIPVILSKSR